MCWTLRFTGCECSKLGTETHLRSEVMFFLCLISRSHTDTYTSTHMHIFLLWTLTAPEHFNAFAFQSPATAALLLGFFFLSTPPLSHFLFLPLSSPGLFNTRGNVTFMSPRCLKPNAPVCQRAQLCEEKWTQTLNVITAWGYYKRTQKVDFSEQ